MLFCFVVGLTLLCCAVDLQMPPLEPPGQKKGQQRPLITAVETIPARSETSSVEVVVLQASTHEPLDASGNESLMATSLEGTQGMRQLTLDLWRLMNVSSRFISPQWRQR
jgi:hypothetical protein